ncbi:MAG: CHAT domain-containing protein, partial [Anaerolineae bacterium]|nr:CHAT domain-containing protein [Anaerolineae bacterium]
MSAVLRIQLSYVSSTTVEVRVEDSARGEPRQVVEMPLQGAAIQTLLNVLEASDTGNQTLTDSEAATLQRVGILDEARVPAADVLRRRVGRLLFNALFPTSDQADHDVRAAFVATLAQAGQQREPVTLQLRFDRDAVDLASLPWELLAYDEEPLVASGRVQLTRYVTFAQATAPYPVTDRLEVLTITARPRDALTLDPAAETDAIRAAFDDLAQRGVVRIHSLSPPTPDALAAAVNARTYHVIHFDGHGVFGRRCPLCGAFNSEDTPVCANTRCGARLDDAFLEGFLLFESNKGDGFSQMVSPRELATVLSERQVRLFIASACQSGAVKGATVFNSIGPRLLLAGIPAVVAMQYSVPVDSTVVFSKEFYAALARSESVAAATSAGRRILVSRGTWHIPALYLRSRDGEGNLFRFRDPQRWQSELVGGDSAVRIYFRPAGSPGPDWDVLHPPEAAPYKFLSPYETADKAVFFGRSGETRELLGEVLQQPVVVLQGPPGIGKTSLVNAGLIPDLLDSGYLVLAVGQHNDPVAALIEAVGRSTALHVDVSSVHDLPGLISVLQQEIGHPVAVVFDQLEEFLGASNSDGRANLARQLAACAAQTLPLPFRAVLVVREDYVGRLTALGEGLPGLWKTPVSLGPL